LWPAQPSGELQLLAGGKSSSAAAATRATAGDHSYAHKVVPGKNPVSHAQLRTSSRQGPATSGQALSIAPSQRWRPIRGAGGTTQQEKQSRRPSGGPPCSALKRFSGGSPAGHGLPVTLTFGPPSRSQFHHPGFLDAIGPRGALQGWRQHGSGSGGSFGGSRSLQGNGFTAIYRLGAVGLQQPGALALLTGFRGGDLQASLDFLDPAKFA